MTPDDAKAILRAGLLSLHCTDLVDASDDDSILFKGKLVMDGEVLDIHAHTARFELHPTDDEQNRRLLEVRLRGAEKQIEDLYCLRKFRQAEAAAKAANERAQIEMEQARQMLRDQASDENRQLREEILRLRLRILQLEAPNSPEAIAAAKAVQG